MKRITHTFISAFLIGILGILYVVPFLVIFCIPRRLRFTNKYAFYVIYSFYYLLLRATFLPVSIYGMFNIPKEPAIIISNHQSALDVPLIAIILQGASHVFLARNDATKFFLIRWLYKQFSIMVDVSSSTTAFKSLRLLLKTALDSSTHLILFPEGQRYTDDTVHPFLAGFAFLAKHTKRPIIPIYIFGVQHAYPPDALLITYAPIHVLIGSPIRYEEKDTHEKFQKKVEDWYRKQRGIVI